MKTNIVVLATLLIMAISCTTDKVTPLFLQIIKPGSQDTVHTMKIIIEGKTTIGATVTCNDRSLFVNDTGYFYDSITSLSADIHEYVLNFKAEYQGRTVPDSRTVYYYP